MNLMSRRLDQETQLLVSISAAVASGCIPCLEKIVETARRAGIDPNKMKESAIIGQYVKDQPAHHMKEAADKLLGAHLLRFKSPSDCPVDDKKKEGRAFDRELEKENEFCGCKA